MSDQASGLGNIFEILWRRRIEFAFFLVLVMLVATFVALHSKPQYSAVSTILLVAEPADNANKMIPTSEQKPLLAADLPSLVLSQTVISRFARQMGYGAEVDVRSKIKARVGEDSNLLPIEFGDHDPSVAVKGANLLASDTTEYYRNITTSRFDSLIDDFTRQLHARSIELGTLDHELQGLAGAYPYVDTNESGSSVYERLVKLRTERDELSATVRGDLASAVEAERLKSVARPLAINSSVNQDAAYSHMSQQYAKDLTDYNRESATASDLYPGLKELGAVVKTESKNVAEARAKAAKIGPDASTGYIDVLSSTSKMQQATDADKAKLGELDSQIGQLNASLNGEGDAARVASLRRQRDASSAAYGILAQRLDKAIADRAEAGSTGSLVSVDPAQQAVKKALSTGMIVAALLAVFGVWLAVSLVLLIERLDVRYRRPVVVERVLGIPVVGNLG